MCNHKQLGSKIQEKDRAILSYLADIQLRQHTDGYGFDLTFVFAQNSYFSEAALRKSFVMSKQNVIEKCVGTPITWQPGCDTTHTKRKKGKGKHKQTVLVKCASFFNFFETVQTEKVVTPASENKNPTAASAAGEGEQAESQKGREESDDDPQAE